MTPTGTRKELACSVHSCPHGCTIVHLGETKVHLCPKDFAAFVKLLLHHAWTNGLEVPSEAASRPIAQVH